MKKQVFSFSVMLSATLFTACMDTDSGTNSYPVAIANGVYVVGTGSEVEGKPSCLTYYNYETKFSTKDVFSQNNGITLGHGVLNDALRYGDKTYIVSDGENTVFVTDAKTMKIKEIIDMTDLLGNKGMHPRRIAAYDGKVYVSTYGGCVAAIDTVNYALAGTYEVGSYPEGLVVLNDHLVVANSDYGNGKASISIIDMKGNTKETITDENIRNPQEIAIAGSNIYYLDYGQYGDGPDYIQYHAGVYRYDMYNKISERIIADATGMACYGTSIVTYNNANGVEETTYSIYDIQTRSTKTFELEGIDIPAAIAIDPVSGNLIVASNHLIPGTSYADYSKDGYVIIYDFATKKKKESFGCGVGLVRIAFNNSIKFIEY